MLSKWISMLAIMALALTGCGKKANEKSSEKAAEKSMEMAIEKGSGGKAKVDISNGGISVKTEGKDKMEMTAGQGAKVPGDFPKDILVYKGATVLSSVKTEGAFNVTLQTTDTTNLVSDTYKEAMKNEGWTEKGATVMGEMTMLQYNKDKREAMVHITSDGGKTTILLMHMQK